MSISVSCVRRARIFQDVLAFPLSFVLAGAACTCLGPLLPSLAQIWHLRDHQTGLLVGTLFVGSFSGTISISENLVRSLRYGAVASCIGMTGFAICTSSNSAFPFALCCLVLCGFGLGRVMSSINLLVGRGARAGQRSVMLARLAAAWCVGALVSPLLATRGFADLSLHLALLGVLLIFPLFGASPEENSGDAIPETMVPKPGGKSRPLALCIVAFFLYGGIETSLSSWLPSLAQRYKGAGTLAPWTSSLFWLGVITGRLCLRKAISLKHEADFLRALLITASGLILWLMIQPFHALFAVTVLLTGCCLGPMFPLILSLVLEWRFEVRKMGSALAACGLGCAVLPSGLGMIASVSSLRLALGAPLFALGALLFLPWQPDDVRGVRVSRMARSPSHYGRI
jgi:fucose permease